MNQLVTTGIVLRRTDYGEADRIVVFLTPDYGKLSVIAKGVRRLKSKLAGGIELFSVSSVTFIRGRSDLGRLVSTRLDRHYGNIVRDIGRVQLGYELIKVMNKATEDAPEPEYFHLLQGALAALDQLELPGELTRLWFAAQLLRLGGNAPNLHTDAAGQRLSADKRYNFDFDAMGFYPQNTGGYGVEAIKLLRLLFAGSSPQLLAKVSGVQELLPTIAPLVQTVQATYVHS